MLLSIEDFKSYINYSKDTYDTEIEVLLKGAEKFIASFCNNTIEQKSISEVFDGDDIINGEIFLKNNINLTDVVISKWNNVTLAWDIITDVYGSEYYLYEQEGRLILNSVSSGKRNYKIDYKAGFTAGIYDYNVPEDLKIAILKITGKYWNKRRSDGLSTESLDSASLTYDAFMSDDIKMILDDYKLFLI